MSASFAPLLSSIHPTLILSEFGPQSAPWLQIALELLTIPRPLYKAQGPEEKMITNIPALKVLTETLR